MHLTPRAGWSLERQTFLGGDVPQSFISSYIKHGNSRRVLLRGSSNLKPCRFPFASSSSPSSWSQSRLSALHHDPGAQAQLEPAESRRSRKGTLEGGSCVFSYAFRVSNQKTDVPQRIMPNSTTAILIERTPLPKH